MRVFVVFVVTVIGLVVCGDPVAAQRKVDPAALDRFFTGFFVDRIGDDVASASVVVVEGDSVVYLRSLGLARPRERVAASPTETVYQVGSNSKLFVATAAMQLVEQGRLQLDDDINRYLHDFQVDGRGAPVTMAQLLTHTSGLDDRAIGRTQAIGDGPLMTLGAFFCRYPPKRVLQGGQQVSYSNNAIALAAHVIEAISGERFDEFAKHHIFTPLRMTSASFQQPLPEALLTRRAAMPDSPPLITYPAIGLAMTTADMGFFLIAHLNGGAMAERRILRAETVERMHAHQFPADPTMPGLAYGFFEANLGGRRALVHSGDYRHLSILALIPEERIGFFLVLNPATELRKPVATTFASGLADVLFGSSPDAAPSEEDDASPAVSPGRAQRYVGTYRDLGVLRSTIERFFVGLLSAGLFPGKGDTHITYDAASRSLLYQPPAWPPLGLVEVGPDRFRTADRRFDAQLLFGGGDRARTLYISAGTRGAHSFERIPWALSQRPQMFFFVGALFVFCLWGLYGLTQIVLAPFHRGRLRPQPPSERWVFWSAILTAIGPVGGCLLFITRVVLSPSPAVITSFPAAFYALPIGFTMACIAAISLAASLLVSWGAINTRMRVCYTTLAVIGLALIPFCVYWRLLGVHV